MLSDLWNSDDMQYGGDFFVLCSHLKGKYGFIFFFNLFSSVLSFVQSYFEQKKSKVQSYLIVNSLAEISGSAVLATCKVFTKLALSTMISGLYTTILRPRVWCL